MERCCTDRARLWKHAPGSRGPPEPRAADGVRLVLPRPRSVSCGTSRRVGRSVWVARVHDGDGFAGVSRRRTMDKRLSADEPGSMFLCGVNASVRPSAAAGRGVPPPQTVLRLQLPHSPPPPRDLSPTPQMCRFMCSAKWSDREKHLRTVERQRAAC